MPSKRLVGLSTVSLPDERHTLLLRAVAWNDQRARRAWDAWRSQVTPEIVTDAEAWLLAAAYRPLRRLGADDPMVSLAGGVYRRTWYVNQLALKRGAGVIAHLRAAGVEVIVLNGAALSLLHYRDVGARPFEHLDMLAGPGGELWETRVPFELMGTPTFALAAPEQLVHICAHGASADDVTAVSWAADATAVLRTAGGALDWERVLEVAHGRRVTATVGEALGWLRQSLDADIPLWMVDRLSAGGAQ
jgi:Uncharacterised nucleotidyltransferase